MTKKIKLTLGQVAIVCDCHAHLVNKYRWCSAWNNQTESFYASRRASTIERLAGSPQTIFMHRLINDTPKGLQTDHINHNTLDNRCCNLRTATYAQNHMNHKKSSSNTSGYKGVSWHSRARKWRSQIMANGKYKHLGFYDSPEQAARAYDIASKELHGEFANINFNDPST